MKKTAFLLGFEFTIGALLAFFLVMGASQLISAWITPYDDCDGNGERCGMRVLTDHRTGLQYLQGQEGGLIPRLDVNGQQIREGAE